MKLKGIELKGTYKIKFEDMTLEIYDERENMIYFEQFDGYWERSEYDKKGNLVYFENSNRYRAKWEYEDANFYGVAKGSEKADDILFALQVMYGEPNYTYRDFQKMDLTQIGINNALAYVKKKGYNKFSYFE